MHVAQIVRSYRDLPLILYHFQTKERDEPRPRAGVLRTREFIMKDSYTFDRDAEGLDAGYEKHIEAYERIFDRAGLEWYRVESDVGMMGGIGAHEYMAPCAAGENDVALAPGYAANVEVASAERAARRRCPPALAAPELVRDAGHDDVEAVAGALGVPAGALLKAFPVVAEDGGLRSWSSCAATTASTRSSCERARRAVPARAARRSSSERIGPAGYIGPVGARRARSCSTAACAPGRLRHGREPARRATCAASSPGATSRSSASTCARSRRATRSTATRSGSSPRSRSATSSSSARATPSRSARPTSTRTAREQLDLDGLLRDRPGAHRRRRRRAVRRRAGDLVAARRSRRGTSSSSASASQGTRRSASSPSACTRSCAATGLRRRSTTTATPARARSSPTPSCSACRCGSPSGGARSRPGELEAQVRRGARAAQRAARGRRGGGGGPVAQPPVERAG